MRIGNRNRRGGRHHGLDRIAAVAQDFAAGFRRQMMRRDDHAALCVNQFCHFTCPTEPIAI